METIRETIRETIKETIKETRRETIKETMKDTKRETIMETIKETRRGNHKGDFLRSPHTAYIADLVALLSVQYLAQVCGVVKSFWWKKKQGFESAASRAVQS